MNEMTGRVDMNEFAEKTGIESSQIVTFMTELAEMGFLKKVGRGFVLTEKGRNVLKAAVPLPWDKRFNFYTAIDQPAGVSAGKISEFYDLIGKVDAASLEFHMGRGDFESWFQTTVADATVAEKLSEIKTADVKGEELRKALAEALKDRYSL
ncbi:MAG: DUF5752 family protein [Candidatus Bathyarchaeota archaeon]|nr:DUF5752 family protein [Candidatus Bathyarchaeota archaeon]